MHWSYCRLALSHRYPGTLVSVENFVSLSLTLSYLHVNIEILLLSQRHRFYMKLWGTMHCDLIVKVLKQCEL